MTAPSSLTVDLSSDQQRLLEALYRCVRIDDSNHGEITTWPTWDYTTYLLEQQEIEAVRAGEAAANLPVLRRTYTPYSLIWRSEASGSRVPQSREQVGLTLVGLARVDPAAADRLAQLIARLAAKEANLPPNPNGVREANEPLNDLLTDFLKGSHRVCRTNMNVRTAAELLQHEYIPIASDTGRQWIYEARLGAAKLAPFRGIETAAAYIDKITALAPLATGEAEPTAAASRFASVKAANNVGWQPGPTGSAAGSAPMTTTSRPAPKRYQIFISSTYNDLVAEREAVTQAVLRTGRCIPAGMELFSASNQPPWDVIRQALDGTDYLILIIGNRSGALVPGEQISYTEKEYRYAIENHIPVLAFLSSSAHPLMPRDIETPKAQRALAAFRARVQDAQLTEEWTTTDDLAGRVPNALWRAFDDDPRPGWVRGESPPAPTPPPPSDLAAAVKWSLKWFDGDRYMLENIGTATAYDVELSAHETMGLVGVEGDPTLEPDDSVTFYAAVDMETEDTRIRVSWRPAPDAEPKTWSRALPARGDR